MLDKQYKPQIVAVQECQLHENKMINLKKKIGITKFSTGDNSTGGVSIYINKSGLFSENQTDIELQAVAVRVST